MTWFIYHNIKPILVNTKIGEHLREAGRQILYNLYRL